MITKRTSRDYAEALALVRAGARFGARVYTCLQSRGLDFLRPVTHDLTTASARSRARLTRVAVWRPGSYRVTLTRR